MTSLSVTITPRADEVSDGRWVTREVYERAELIIDGTRLSTLLEGTQVGSTQSEATPFEMAGVDAVAVLMGRTPYEEGPSTRCRRRQQQVRSGRAGPP